MTHPYARTAPVLLNALLLAGCGSADPGPEAAVADSAGVRVVDNPEPAGRVALVLEPEPVLSIGTLDGAPAYTFREVADARRLEDGRVVVSDGPEIRFYDPDGRYLRTVGGEGEGPGEFSYLTGVVPCGGELWAGDLRQQRLTVFDPTGEFLRTEPVPASGSPIFALRLVGCDADTGRPLLRSPGGADQETPGDGPPRLQFVRLVDPGRVDTVAGIPALQPRRSLPGPFAPRTRFALDDGTIHALDDDGIAVHSYGPGGRLRQVARVPHSPRPVTDEELRRAVDSMVAEMPEAFHDAIRRQLDEQGVEADRMPAVHAFLADDVGRLWIQRFRPAWEPADTAWLLLRDDGTLAGTVVLPDRFTPHHIGRDWILGVARDELDVPYVRLHRLRPPDGSGGAG